MTEFDTDLQSGCIAHITNVANHQTYFHLNELMPNNYLNQC